MRFSTKELMASVSLACIGLACWLGTFTSIDETAGTAQVLPGLIALVELMRFGAGCAFGAAIGLPFQRPVLWMVLGFLAQVVVAFLALPNIT